MELKKYKEALEDFEEAKKIEPKTANVDTNIEKANEKLKEQVDEKKNSAETEVKVENNTDSKETVEKEENPKDQDQETNGKEGFTKSDAELLLDIEVLDRLIVV